MATRGYKTLLVLLACGTLVIGAAHGAEEVIRTPSDDMKEAVKKLGKAPATIGKSLQGLTDAATEKFRQTFGTKAKTETKADAMDMNVPKKAEAPVAPAKLKELNRDPFRPTALRTKVSKAPRENLSPLERYELSQLKLVGIVWDIKEPRAMVEDSGGLGYVIKVGTPIGSNDGKVKAIHRNEVVVEELYSDDYGAQKKRDVSMKLLTE
jgi:type IV pilus assembly protein PilP